MCGKVGGEERWKVHLESCTESPGWSRNVPSSVRNILLQRVDRSRTPKTHPPHQTHILTYLLARRAGVKYFFAPRGIATAAAGPALN